MSQLDFLTGARLCCYHETAQNLERTELASILDFIASQMEPEWERYSATFDPCLWLRLKADDLRAST
jgi:hypothetical protein